MKNLSFRTRLLVGPIHTCRLFHFSLCLNSVGHKSFLNICKYFNVWNFCLLPNLSFSSSSLCINGLAYEWETNWINQKFFSNIFTGYGLPKTVLGRSLWSAPTRIWPAMTGRCVIYDLCDLWFVICDLCDIYTNVIFVTQ